MKKIDLQAGFSAVELLITLLIAFLFIMMGYQLYGAIIKDGGEARVVASANNDGYHYLRHYASIASTLTCGAPVTSPQAGVTVSVTCPSTTLPAMRLITVKTVRGNPPQEISHAIYSTQ